MERTRERSNCWDSFLKRNCLRKNSFVYTSITIPNNTHKKCFANDQPCHYEKNPRRSFWDCFCLHHQGVMWLHSVATKAYNLKYYNYFKNLVRGLACSPNYITWHRKDRIRTVSDHGKISHDLWDQTSSLYRWSEWNEINSRYYRTSGRLFTVHASVFSLTLPYLLASLPRAIRKLFFLKMPKSIHYYAKESTNKSAYLLTTTLHKSTIFGTVNMYSTVITRCSNCKITTLWSLPTEYFYGFLIILRINSNYFTNQH
jgi:hypothetical protein